MEAALTPLRTANPSPIVLFDTLDDTDLPVIGRLISSVVPLGGQLFCAGSSGVGYALVAHWRQAGMLPFVQNQRHPVEKRGTTFAARQTIIVSGSCSPNTDRQIGRAVADGFVEVACDSVKLASPDGTEAAVREAVDHALPALREGRHVVVHTARGTADPRRLAVEEAVYGSAYGGRTQGLAAARSRLGHNLGRILRAALEASDVRRAVICGGDTATQAGRALGITALEFLAPAATGAPLCCVHAPGSSLHGCELICKGGQMGPDSFFPDVAAGRCTDPGQDTEGSSFPFPELPGVLTDQFPDFEL